MEDDAEKRGLDLQIAVVLINPGFPNLFMKKLTRERVVPIDCRKGFVEVSGSGSPDRSSPLQPAATSVRYIPSTTIFAQGHPCPGVLSSRRASPAAA